MEKPRGRIAIQVAASRGKSSDPKSLKLRREQLTLQNSYLEEADIQPLHEASIANELDPSTASQRACPRCRNARLKGLCSRQGSAF